MKDWEWIEVKFKNGEQIRIFSSDYARMIEVAAIMEDMERLKQIAKLFAEKGDFK